MNEPILSDISASLTASYYQCPRYTDTDIEALCITMNELKNEIRSLMVNTATGSLQLPLNIVEPAVNDYIKQNYKLGRPPMEAEIKDAIAKTKTMKGAADYLGISTTTLKRYCSLYEKNSEGGTTPLSLWRPTRGIKALSKSTLP